MKKHFIFVIIFCIACFSGFAQSSITIEPTTNNQLKLRGNGNGGYWPSIIGYRSLGTSAAPIAVNKDNWLLSIDGSGYNGSVYSNAGGGGNTAIQIVADENFTPTANGTYLKFSTITKGTVGSPTERMRINSDGNIGIGSTTPNAPLQFANTLVNRKIVLYETANDDHQYVGFGNTSGEFRYQSNRPGTSHVFYSAINATSSKELMRIKGDGNVGIGSTTPNAPLQFANTLVNRKIVLYETANDDHQYVGFGNTSGEFRYQSNRPETSHVFYSAINATSSKELMRIKGDGNVGIGNTNPTTAKLVIGGTAGNQGLDLSTADQYANVRVLQNTNGTTDKDMYFGFLSGTTSSLHLYSNNSETVTIKGGKMGIGTTNPVNKLDVLGTIRAYEMVVEIGWADYVFDEKFKLKPLNEVEQFIKTNKHLPDVPSAKYLQENGGKVSELMTKMMQKIEELTLYSIQQEKKIEDLEKRFEQKK